MSLFENKIRDNLSTFDTEEPLEGHFERFSTKLDEQNKDLGYPVRKKVFRLLAVAAVFILLISTGFFFYFNPPASLLKTAGTQVAKITLPVEVQMMMDYYNQIAESRMDTLQTMAPSKKESKILQEMAGNEIKILDQIIDSLKVEYNRNKNNDQIYSAIVITQQKKAEMLEIIINKVAEGNEWQKEKYETNF